MTIAIKRSLMSGCALALLACATAARAQEAAANVEAASGADIIVTATKSGSSLSDTPAAVSAISGDDLGPGGVQNVGDLASVIPNLSVGDQFGVNRTFIRGIGLTSIDLGADGAVAFLQDGAMISRPAAQLAGFFDLQQVEVLRGPQGTTYGRGATAGVINMVTKRPSNELDGYLRLSYGNYDSKVAEGGVGGPIAGDMLMARISGKWEKRDGYGRNLVTGNFVDDRDAYALRGSVLSRPADDLEILLVGDYFKEDDNNYGFHYFGPSNVPEAFLPGVLLGGQTIFGFYAGRGEETKLRNLYSDDDAINRREGYGGTGIVTWTPGDLSLVSTTAYREFDRFNRDDLDVSNVAAFGQNNYTERSKTFSQELTFNYASGPFALLGGAMYFHERLFGEVRVPTTNLAAYFNIVLGTMLPPNLFDAGNYLQRGTVVTDAYGAYLQGTYEIAPRLKITAGARYNYEKRVGRGRFTFEAQGLDIPTDKSEGWGAITPKFLIEYRTQGDTLLYASATRGFKSGVINIGSINAVIDPEYVWSYEAGFKAQTADRSLALTGAVFYYDYKNLQVGFVNANSIVETINAASARNIGAEIEATIRPAPNLSFNLFGTYLNAEFKNFCNGYYRGVNATGEFALPVCPTNPALVSLKGKRLPNAPKVTIGAVANYTVELGDAGKLDLSGDINFQDDVFFTEFNNVDAAQKSFALINASVTWRSMNERFSISAWGRNLTNKFVIANNIIAAPLYANVRVGSLRPPRTYGLTLGVDF